jgi:hypothetical protein
MQRRVGVLFATTVLIFVMLAGCRTHKPSEEDDRKAAINVVLAHEQGVQAYSASG